MSTEGYADIIRLSLKAAGEPITVDDIIDGSVGDIDRNGLKTILRQRISAGEVLQHVRDSKCFYTLNPDHTFRATRRSGRLPPAPPAEPLAVPPANLKATLTAPAVDPLPASDAIVAPNWLAGQLTAVGEALDVAVLEACKAKLPHALITHLVTASSAMRSATLALLR